MAGVADLFKNFANVVVGNSPQNPALPGLPNGTPNPANPPASVVANPGVPNPGNEPNPKPGDSPQLSSGPNANAASGATPLDQFKEIWQTPENAVDPNAPITFTADPAKLLAASKNLDFKQFITPEVTARIAAGGEDAVKAMAEAMNMVAQGTYAQSASATTKIVEKAIQSAQEKFLAQIPSLVRNGTVSESLRTENAKFNHPAVAPVIKNLEKQMAIKFPNSSASDLTKMAQDYFTALASEFTPPPQKDPNARDDKSQDFSQYFQ
jgi:hypothetical protein